MVGVGHFIDWALKQMAGCGAERRTARFERRFSCLMDWKSPEPAEEDIAWSWSRNGAD